ncbi:MAG: DUF456 domain-containing protein [Blastochloris sp.]|nr:DUF456 domain-containing protein [Blastochloris sp.]
MTETIGWISAGMLILAGVAGIFLPVMPGLPLIWLGILTHKLLVPEMISWWTVVLLGLVVVATSVVEWLSGVWGAKAFRVQRVGDVGRGGGRRDWFVF